MPYRAVPTGAPRCGIDVGLRVFATVVDEDGTVTRIHSPDGLRKAQRRLRKANKALSRTVPGSVNRGEARVRVAKLHLDISNRRADFLHKTTTTLATTKSAIAVETLNVAGMVRNRRLARAVVDAGFGEFARQLGYKSSWYGSTLWRADPWYPSSKQCSRCGSKFEGLTTGTRAWVCPACGALHDRDINAAANLLMEMRRAAYTV
jgi:putative transposase